MTDVLAPALAALPASFDELFEVVDDEPTVSAALTSKAVA